MSQHETKGQIDTQVRADRTPVRLTPETVERQIAEMYSALDGLATCADVDPQDYTDTLNRAREIEADLRTRLAAQDRLDRAAPLMLELLKESIAENTCEWTQEQWEDWDDRAETLIAEAEGHPTIQAGCLDQNTL